LLKILKTKKMKKAIKKSAYLFLIFMAMLQSCSDDNGDSYVEPEPEPTLETVKLSTDAVLGSILTDSEGKTLYFFSKDTKETSRCVDGCVDIWPIFYSENLVLDNRLDINDFNTITRTDGELQTTYKGWPLYYYYDDNTAGDTNGEKVNNVWFAAKPDYSLMYANAQLQGHDGNNYTSAYTVGDEETSYIVDIEGRTLYTFSNDTNNTNNFTAPDFSNNGVWPIAEITLDEIPSILNKDDFGTIDVYGRTQLTYKGWPLYYFGQDTARGDNKGVSFPAPGVWPIANVNTEMAPSAPTVKLVSDAVLGSILTDAEGKTLYFFSDDVKDTSECLEGCLNIWPIFYSEDLVVDGGLDINDFDAITRTDGELQTTYQGWPLYYYAADVNAGDTNGEAVGDEWFVAKPDYSLMYVYSQLVGHDDNNYTSSYMVGEGETGYIVDIDGRTLYTFSKDTNNTNTFTAPDFSNNGVWPIAEITLDQIPSILNKADFGTIEVYGRTQLTYRGWPLYYFGQDTERGDNKGVSFPSAGVWPIANVDTPVAPN
jgi:predicted lipoprotein with Yx(FWY)xxD motif